MNVRPDLTGRRFSRLLVLSEDKRPRGPAFWHVECDCGTRKVVRAAQLLQGTTVSCGCYHRERASAFLRKVARRHGQTNTPTHKSWLAMMQRCQDPACRGYARYGGRGITVCERWRVFENFLADMGERPPGTSIDRIDNSKGYEPGNCRWATALVQGRNRRSVKLLSFRGETKCVAEWCLELGIAAYVVYQRLDSGWDTERALTTPVRRRPAISRATGEQE